MKNSFLLVVLLIYHFYFTFILFVHTGHANFNFSQCSIFTEHCFLALKKVQIVKSHSSSYSHHPIKNSSSKIFDPPPLQGIPPPPTP